MLRGNLKLILAPLVAVVFFCGGILAFGASHNWKIYQPPLGYMTEISFSGNGIYARPNYPGVSFHEHFLPLSRNLFLPLSKQIYYHFRTDKHVGYLICLSRSNRGNSSPLKIPERDCFFPHPPEVFINSPDYPGSEEIINRILLRITNNVEIRAGPDNLREFI